MVHAPEIAALPRIHRREAWIASVLFLIATALMAAFYIQT